ncbi:putative Ribonuclease 2 [Tripterygium wilfordii]|uniref:Putative Ribonuclease 2 n=1 Tax=Tripterygium wilfordii TaxID=458696 RepID=A0A7J7C2R1_TRIWF|nr:extracellular ribonuclease LE-like [Tripterygium wilfordii]KAF5728147.1 putative Ribonuclease 2 [Tripterygium wilfordii]
MERKLAFVVVVFCCFAISGCNSLRLEQFSVYNPSLKAKTFTFYKLGLQWPQSFCRSDGVICDTSPTQSYFTIKSLSPQYNPDEEVPPYATNQTQTCTDSTPTSPKDITLGLLGQIQPDMAQYWPDLINSPQKNLDLWQDEWAKHGMCSSYPTDPVKYFKVALDFIKANDLRDSLSAVAQIIPTNSRTYSRYDFSNAITRALQVFPEIYCSTDVRGQVQLEEIRICIGISGTLADLKDCPTRFRGCDSNAQLHFPAAP